MGWENEGEADLRGSGGESGILGRGLLGVPRDDGRPLCWDGARVLVRGSLKCRGGVPRRGRGVRRRDGAWGIEDPDPEDGTMVGGIQFRVIEAWEGVPGESVVLYGQDAAYYGELEEGEMVVSSSCAYVFERGERYLVYASRYEDGLQTGACDRTAPLAEAEKDLDALGPPADRLAETGGLPPSLASVLVAVAAFSISCGVLSRRVRS